MVYYNILYVQILQNEKKKSPLKSRFRQNYLNNFVSVRSDFSTLVGAPIESLRLIIIYSMFNYSFGIKTNFLESFGGKKKAL